MAEATLEDEVIEAFYSLGKDLKDIPTRTYVKSLKGILHEEASKYFHAKKDRETHELKWESDGQLRAFTDSLWEKAAAHLAEHYLKLKPGQIKEMKAAKDPEDETRTQFETFMSAYLGSDKEEFFEAMKQNEIMNPENIVEYFKPLYTEHIKRAQAKRLGKIVKTNEQGQQLLRYVRLLKEHNPDALKGVRVPKYFRSIQDVAGLYTTALERIPDTYHPKKVDTYQKKPAGGR